MALGATQQNHQRSKDTQNMSQAGNKMLIATNYTCNSGLGTFLVSWKKDVKNFNKLQTGIIFLEKLGSNSGV